MYRKCGGYFWESHRGMRVCAGASGERLFVGLVVWEELGDGVVVAYRDRGN